MRVYDLQRQVLVKKLQTGCKWVSALSVHPTGDHLLVGSYDKRVCWFDLDLGATPFKTLRYHEQAVRSVDLHRAQPLMCTASDDGSLQVFHAKVYSDLVRNPLLLPVKVLRGHTASGGFGVLDCKWHPKLPWLLSAGADGNIFLWQDLH